MSPQPAGRAAKARPWTGGRKSASHPSQRRVSTAGGGASVLGPLAGKLSRHRPPAMKRIFARSRCQGSPPLPAALCTDTAQRSSATAEVFLPYHHARRPVLRDRAPDPGSPLGPGRSQLSFRTGEITARLNQVSEGRPAPLIHLKRCERRGSSPRCSRAGAHRPERSGPQRRNGIAGSENNGTSARNVGR